MQRPSAYIRYRYFYASWTKAAATKTDTLPLIRNKIPPQAAGGPNPPADGSWTGCSPSPFSYLVP
jgi:hypothetical protein